MTNLPDRKALHDTLAALGADLSRWPRSQASAARAALLADPDFRRAWERSRALDDALLQCRETLAEGIAASGAVERVRQRVLAGLPPDPLAHLPWRRIAAAVLLAGVVGAAMDLVLPDAGAELSEVVALDPLETVGEVALQ